MLTCMGKRTGIDQDGRLLDVYKLAPRQGDSVLVVNCGEHFEVRCHSGVYFATGLYLTDEDIARIKHGLITWN